MRKIYLLGTVFLLLLVGFFAWNNMFADNNLAKNLSLPRLLTYREDRKGKKGAFPKGKLLT